MKIAVTGISGYLGRVLLPLLEADPDIESIVGIDLIAPRLSSKVKFVKRDVRSPDLKGDLQGCDAMVHMAFVVMPLKSEKEMDSINISGTQNAVTCAAEAGIETIIYTSSVAAYGIWPDNPIPIREDWSLRPMPEFYYARTKALAERWLNTFEREHADIRIVRLRPCIFVGPEADNLMVELVSGPAMLSILGVDTALQFVWDEDVARGILLALKKDVRGAFNLAGDGHLSMQELAREAGKKTLPLPYPVVLGGAALLWKLQVWKNLHPGWIRAFRYPVIADTTRARRELGWEPTFDSRGAIQEFLKSRGVAGRAQ